MRAVLCVLVAVGLLGFTQRQVRADEQADLKALIEKSIKAHGGKEKLAKYQANSMKVKGKVNAQGQTFDYSMEVMSQEPDKSKFEMDLDIMGMKFTISQVINGDKGWMRNSATNQTDELSKEKMAEAKEEFHAHRVESLLVLSEKGYKLSTLGEGKVGDKATVGIRVSFAGRRDVTLHLDKNDGLLLRCERIVKDDMQGDKEILQDSIYSDYKETEGVKYPGKMVIHRDGKEFVTGDVTEYKVMEKIDDSVFVKP